MYSVVEINAYNQAIGIIDLDEVMSDSGMSFYWNHKLKDEKTMRTRTLSWSEAYRAYLLAKTKFPNKEFEIR